MDDVTYIEIYVLPTGMEPVVLEKWQLLQTIHTV